MKLFAISVSIGSNINIVMLFAHTWKKKVYKLIRKIGNLKIFYKHIFGHLKGTRSH